MLPHFLIWFALSHIINTICPRGVRGIEPKPRFKLPRCIPKVSYELSRASGMSSLATRRASTQTFRLRTLHVLKPFSFTDDETLLRDIYLYHLVLLHQVRPPSL